MKTVHIKEGDLVYAIKNSEWGVKPMKVHKDHGFGFSCVHWDDPRLIGWFHNDDIIHCSQISEERKADLQKLLDLKDEISKLKEKLF